MPAKRISRKLRRQVIERARGYCEYCRCLDSITPGPFSVDHILPKSQGGHDVLSNLAYACHGCNGKKYDRVQALDTLTGKLVNLFHPRKQNWLEHFAWNEDFTQVAGLSPIGRATVKALELNRAGVVNLRKLLRNSSQHPPA